MLQIPACFCQYVTNRIFKELIKQEFSLPKGAEDHSTTHPITNGKNALRYVVGYVCRKVRDNIKKLTCKIPGKGSMI